MDTMRSGGLIIELRTGCAGSRIQPQMFDLTQGFGAGSLRAAARPADAISLPNGGQKVPRLLQGWSYECS